MTIDEAISMLESILKDRRPYEGGWGNDAIKLGIEAMKRVRADRYYEIVSQKPLPGETTKE